MPNNIVAELAPNGTLRAAINLANFLLVSSRADNGDPQGVAPDLAAAIADSLGVGVSYVPFERPGPLADAAVDGVWDIGLIAVEPARAEHIEFTEPYVEIEATYLVSGHSEIQTITEVDQPGVRIAIAARSAYDLYLSRNLQHAELVRAEGIDGSFDIFVSEGLDVLAGLRPRLLTDVTQIKNARILDGRFTAVQQAVGTPSGRTASAAYLRDFVVEAKASGLVAELIARHQVDGLSVAS